VYGWLARRAVAAVAGGGIQGERRRYLWRLEYYYSY